MENQQKDNRIAPIGIFDSGFGGLTVLRKIRQLLPEYDYLYLGDNARSPYGSRSFETVYTYTLQAVTWLFDRGCRLVVLACNTASAKALRTIQQNDLPRIAPDNRVLGVLRPVTECVGSLTRTGHIGIFGTSGTVDSRSYIIEITKYFPQVAVTQEACPMWVSLVENGEAESDGADYFIKKHVDRLCAADPLIDTVVLGCTHYPLLESKIRKYLPAGITIVSQGAIVARSLRDYLGRHAAMAAWCTRGGTRQFFTSEKAAVFDRPAGSFYGGEIASREMRWGE
jgi:glutamate racemase